MHADIDLADLPSSEDDRPKREAAGEAKKRISKLYIEKPAKPAEGRGAQGIPFPTPSTSGRKRVRQDSDKEDEFLDADTTLNSSDLPIEGANTMVDYDVEDGTDAKDAGVEARAIKFDFDRNDITSWLQRYEIRLEYAGVKSQWLKRLCLENVLPQDVASVCKDYFSKTKTQAAENDAKIYHQCKLRLLEKYGPKPEENFQKALKIVMTGLPSQAAHELRDMICQKATKFDVCCCKYQVASQWKSILPSYIKAHISHLDIVNDFDNVLRTADCIYNANKQSAQVAAVKQNDNPKKSVSGASGGSAGATASSTTPDLDTLADAPAFDQINQLTEQLAAFNKNFKKRTRGQINRGADRRAQQMRGGAGKPQGQGQPRDRGNPHPDGPPDNACGMHWRWGRSAHYCQNKDQCPWANFTAAKPK